MAAKWSIRELEYEISKDDKSNVITSVHWNCTDSKEVTKDGEKVTYNGGIYDVTGLDTSDLSSFVEYSDLDEDTVVSWVKAKLGDDKVQSVENQIESQINKQENPAKGKGKPW